MNKEERKREKGMGKRRLNVNRLEAIRLFANGQIDRKEFRERMKIKETTAMNYEQMINRFKKTLKRPTGRSAKSVCREFFVWADEWEKDHRKSQEPVRNEEQNRKIKYKIELIVWEYT